VFSSSEVDEVVADFDGDEESSPVEFLGDLRHDASLVVLDGAGFVGAVAQGLNRVVGALADDVALSSTAPARAAR